MTRPSKTRTTGLLYLGDFPPSAQQKLPAWMPPVLLVEAVSDAASPATYRCYPLGLDHVPGWQDTELLVPVERLAVIPEQVA